MNSMYTRTEKLVGKTGIRKIKKASIIIFGLGGVGSYAVEALARAGVGHLTIVDGDSINETNLNRQLFALHSTIGKQKTEVARKRLADINKKLIIDDLNLFYNEKTAADIKLDDYDYIVDAIDTVSSKLLLIEQAFKLGVPIISSMGTGNRLNPTKLCITDINKTSGCPLARVIRQELRKRDIPFLKVVYSSEEPIIKERQPASISFVPAVAGMLLVSEVIKDILYYDL